MCVRHHLPSPTAPDVRFNTSTMVSGNAGWTQTLLPRLTAEVPAAGPQECSTLFVGSSGKVAFVILPWVHRNSSSRSTGSRIQFRSRFSLHTWADDSTRRLHETTHDFIGSWNPHWRPGGSIVPGDILTWHGSTGRDSVPSVTSLSPSRQTAMQYEPSC